MTKQLYLTTGSDLAPSKKLSLERLLQQQGFGTRKMCRILILNEAVTVNGELCNNPAKEFAIDQALQYSVNGEAWQYRARSYIMMHKPAHYECTHKTQYYPTIYTLLPKPLVERGVQCIGRLDEDTTGLILLSDNGQFIHKISSPKHHIIKVYEVSCKHPVMQADIDTLLKGVQLTDEPNTIRALTIKQLSNKLIHLTISEGKYHQVKRMIAAVANRVEALKRIQIGELHLPADLKAGEWRWLSEQDLSKLI